MHFKNFQQKCSVCNCQKIFNTFACPFLDSITLKVKAFEKPKDIDRKSFVCQSVIQLLEIFGGVNLKCQLAPNLARLSSLDMHQSKIQ